MRIIEWASGKAPDMSFANEKEYKAFISECRKRNLGRFKQGTEGLTLRVSEDYVLKRFKNEVLDMIDPDNLTQFNLLEIPSYYFIEGELTVNDRIVGGIYKYAPGVPFKNVAMTIPFDNLYQASQNHERHVYLLTDEYVAIEDATPDNRLWDKENQQINTIDTSAYQYYCINKTDTNLLYKENIIWLSDNLVECLLEERTQELITKYKLLKDIIYVRLGNAMIKPRVFIQPSDLIIQLREELYKIFGIVFEDMQSVSKVLTKKNNKTP